MVIVQFLRLSHLHQDLDDVLTPNVLTVVAFDRHKLDFVHLYQHNVGVYFFADLSDADHRIFLLLFVETHSHNSPYLVFGLLDSDVYCASVVVQKAHHCSRYDVEVDSGQGKSEIFVLSAVRLSFLYNFVSGEGSSAANGNSLFEWSEGVHLE